MDPEKLFVTVLEVNRWFSASFPIGFPLDLCIAQWEKPLVSPTLPIYDNFLPRALPKSHIESPTPLLFPIHRIPTPHQTINDKFPTSGSLLSIPVPSASSVNTTYLLSIFINYPARVWHLVILAEAGAWQRVKNYRMPFTTLFCSTTKYKDEKAIYYFDPKMLVATKRWDIWLRSQIIVS